jgi:hypothetical protein
MARPWRIGYDGAYYHVLSRGDEGRDIFYDDKDRENFIQAFPELTPTYLIRTFRPQDPAVGVFLNHKAKSRMIRAQKRSAM